MWRLKFRSSLVCGSLALLSVGSLMVALAAVRKPHVEPAALAERFLESLPGTSGLCVHVGVRDGELAMRLAGEGRHLVHGIARQPDAVKRAQTRIHAAGMAGIVSVESGSVARLPYADNLVNLLVADQLGALQPQGFQVAEVLRVLRPGGVAWLGDVAGESLDEKGLRSWLAKTELGDAKIEIIERDGLWAKLIKPRPESMDTWTHQRRDASGNPVSTDTEVGVPSGVRWVAGPNWPTGYRKSSVPGVVTTGDTLVYIFEDEVQTERGRKPQNSLLARDPFNGLMLWKRPTVSTAAPLICIDQRVYTVIEEDGPLVALDARTGEVVRSYNETKSPEKALYVDGLLVTPLADGRLGCVAADSGEVKWRLDESRLKHFLAADASVFVHTDDSRRGGRSEFICLDLPTGKERWRQSTDSWSKGSWDLLLHHDGILMAATSKANHAIDAADGRLLWSYAYSLIGHGGSYSKILCMDGLVWVHAAKTEGKDQYSWEGLDPRSGEVAKRVVQPEDYKYKHRCSYDVATGRYFLCGSMDFADLETGEYEHFDAARNSCRAAGMIPANGLVYTFPHACGCYAMLRGFMGLATDDVEPSAKMLFEGERLHKGPAFDEPLATASTSRASKSPEPSDWPTYRHDAQRSGSTSDAGPEKLNILWSAEVDRPSTSSKALEWDHKVGGRLSSPVTADGLVLVAAVDRNRLSALDEASGAERWSFTAGGRIDCPPTVDQGRCYLGARDGSIYCLRLSDGELIWRFDAAPLHRRIVAYGQLESPWPVVGGVLMYDGLCYFAVGRHSGADGGVIVGALEPQTGKLVWAEHPEGLDGVPDVLNGDAGTIQMASIEFDARTGQQDKVSEARLRGGRLGLLNDAWYERPIAMRKNLQLWTAGSRAEGQILAFNDATACAFHACEKVAGGDGVMSGDAKLTGQSGRDREWSVKMPLGVRLHGMALAPERVYVAGLLEVAEKSEEPSGPAVRAYTAKDGKLVAEAALDSPPVHDGLIVAGGRVYVSTQGGKLVCLGEK